MYPAVAAYAADLAQPGNQEQRREKHAPGELGALWMRSRKVR